MNLYIHIHDNFVTLFLCENTENTGKMSQIIPAETNLCHLKNQISDFYCEKKS